MTQTTHSTNPPPSSPQKPIDILILGAGWTYQFLSPLLTTSNLTHAATTRTGHDSTIPFTFHPSSTDPTPYTLLPPAHVILITFPLLGTGQSQTLTSSYNDTHPSISSQTRWIQLGSVGIFNAAPGWNDDSSSPDSLDANPRAIAESELLALLGPRACVLNLAGLYGRERQPRKWVKRVVGSKADVKGKGSVHLVHGMDVARGVVGVVGRWESGGLGLGGRRWIVSDLRVYDWWDLVMSWGGGEDGDGDGDGDVYRRWVGELMREEGVRALPREKEMLGRLLDGRGFWEAIGRWPGEGRVG